MNNQELPAIIYQSFSVSSVTGQCDACSPVVFVTSEKPRSNSSQVSFSASPALITQPLDSNYAAVLSPITQTFSVLNVSAMCYLESGATLVQDVKGRNVQEQMLELGLLVPQESASIQVQPDHQTEVPQTLAAWLHVTDHCNLRCAYCYLAHAQAEMSLDIGKTAIEATLRSAMKHGYREVKFKYAGGEPLLRFSLVKSLHRYARNLAEQNQLTLDGVVLSNGTLLTEAMVREMRTLGLRLMISADMFQTPGVSENSGSLTQRIYPDGRDAAADALRGIELALECGLTPEITITVSGRNVAQLPELLAWVLARELPFSLNFYRENGCSACHSDLQLEEGQFIEGMLAAYRVIEANLPKRSLLASLADMANFAAPHLRRCSVGRSYLVVDTQGRVSKCQMQMDKPVTNIHAADPLAELRADQNGIQNLVVDEKEECRECQWKYWCAGGCPLETYRATGRYDVKSPHCRIYKALYPEVLRLEGLRLLKCAEDTEHGDTD